MLVVFYLEDRGRTYARLKDETWLVLFCIWTKERGKIEDKDKDKEKRGKEKGLNPVSASMKYYREVGRCLCS